MGETSSRRVDNDDDDDDDLVTSNHNPAWCLVVCKNPEKNFARSRIGAFRRECAKFVPRATAGRSKIDATVP